MGEDNTYKELRYIYSFYKYGTELNLFRNGEASKLAINIQIGRISESWN